MKILLCSNNVVVRERWFSILAGLMAGFTTERDLGTEGAEYADVSVQKAINEGRIPGPRLQVATKAIVADGKADIVWHHATRGEVWVDGVEISGFKERRLGSIRRKVGMMFQGGALFDSFTVGQNVAWYTSRDRRYYDYVSWFGRMGDVGMNYARVWMAAWGFWNRP